MTERRVPTAAADVREGDLLDLWGDRYADPPDADPYGHRTVFETEYVTVIDVERETGNCVRIDTDCGSFGFPPDHPIPAIRG